MYNHADSITVYIYLAPKGPHNLFSAPKGVVKIQKRQHSEQQKRRCVTLSIMSWCEETAYLGRASHDIVGIGNHNLQRTQLLPKKQANRFRTVIVEKHA